MSGFQLKIKSMRQQVLVELGKPTIQSSKHHHPCSSSFDYPCGLSKEALTSAGLRLQEFEASLWEGVKETQEALFLDKLSESLRRLCAYSVDMAEILLNIDAHRNASEVTI